ncbi:MAG: hypothetical protein ACLTOQ_11240 [Gallintestinimicrobium sp.]|uniref:hypothetical protein n=1 Tax=Gallintestinimicrobium sp. TaxID=2981655 RepID=UPI003990E264
MKKIVLSTLGHTWILDLDGTIVKHNGYKTDGVDSFLPGAKEFLNSIPEDDMIIFLTSRTEEYRILTESFLKKNKMRYDHIIYGAPYGERIIVNDNKPSGLKMSVAITKGRDSNVDIKPVYDETL